MKPILDTSAITIGAVEATGHVVSFQLSGRAMLDGAAPGGSDLHASGRPLALKPAPAPALWTNVAAYPQSIIGDALNEMHGGIFCPITPAGLSMSRAP